MDKKLIISKKSMRRFTFSVLFLCLSVFASFSYAETTKTIIQVAQSGAPGLAMHMLDQKQKYLSNGSEAFLRYERQRHQILRRWKQWKKGLDHLNRLPKSLPASDQSWADTLKVIYFIELQQYDKALQRVRTLLWSDKKVSKEQFSLWQKLVIRIYLKSQKIQDAEKAMLRYQQDYSDQATPWLLLQAEVLIRSGRSDEVADLVENKIDDHFLLFQLLAQLNTKAMSNELIYTKATAKAEDETLTDELRAKFLLLAARAAYISGSAVRVALNLDKVAHINVEFDDVLFPFSGDQIWDAYIELGRNIGNQKRLLLGDDEQWFAEVEKTLPNFSILEKSLLSVIALQSGSENNRNRAFKKLVALILKNKDGIMLLKKLFIGTEKFSDYSQIPHQVRYILVDDALENNEIIEASKLISKLTQPEGVDKFKWELRRARILIMGADYQEGTQILEQLIKEDDALTSKDLDQITQVLFDLQSVEQHDTSIKLFDLLLTKGILPKRKREIFFWQAQSYSKLSKFEDAALSYFNSAYFLNSHGSDPWGQTARYNAAEALAEAGLTGDAERTFSKLLGETKSKKRRSVIQSRLKGLWLKLKNEDNISSQ
jgi:hypothetical protein